MNKENYFGESSIIEDPKKKIKLEIRDGSVVEKKIADGAITEKKIMNDSVTTDKIRQDAVTTETINNSAVTTEKINNGSVTLEKIAEGAVSVNKIKDSAVVESKIDDKAVTNVKIGDAAVDTRIIKNESVTNEKLANESVTKEKIFKSSITTEKLANESVSEEKLQSGLRNTIVTTRDKTIELDNKKANITDVDYALERLENKIGDRVVVEGNVTNLPDDEDLTSVSTLDGREVMKFNDRAYEPSNFSGKGYKILRKNIKRLDLPTVTILVSNIPSSSGDIIITINGKATTVSLNVATDTTTAIIATKIGTALKASLDDYDVFVSSNTIILTCNNSKSTTPSSIDVGNTSAGISVKDSITKSERKNVLEQDMINDPNTIYEIKYDFDLCGNTINITEKSELKFEGGSFSNGFINFNKCSISSQRKSFENIKFSNINYIEASWFGITPDSSDICYDFNNLIETISSMGEIPTVTIVFKDAKYITSGELRIGKRTDGTVYQHCISIVGNPIFYLENKNATCLYIEFAKRARYEFSCHRMYPAIWANDNSIGVVLVNCLYCSFKIHNVKFFTYGIITRADANGFCWNELYIDEIYCSLQSFVIESIKGGWPNANNVYGGIGFNINTGNYITDGAKAPVRGIVCKSDGKYGANGWTFNGLWFERQASQTPDYIAIDICNFINKAPFRGFIFNGVRSELYHLSLIQVDSRYVSKIYLQPSIVIAGNDVALDYDGTFVTDDSVINLTTPTLRSKLATVDLSRNSQNTLNCKNYEIYRGLIKFSITIDGKIYPYIKKNGYLSIALQNISDNTLYIKYYGRLLIFFLNSNKELVSIDTCKSYVDYNKFRFFNDKTGIIKDSILNKYEYRRVTIKDNKIIKYMVLSFFETVGDKCTIDYRKNSDNALTPQICNLFGNYSKDDYVSNIDINTLRAKFETGDRYIDINKNKVYLVIEGGSAGYISSKHINGEENTSLFTTNDDVSDLLVGDIISVEGKQYSINSITSSEDGNVIGVNEKLLSNIQNKNLSLVPAILVNELDIRSIEKISNETVYILLCKDSKNSSCFIEFFSSCYPKHIHTECYSGFVQINGNNTDNLRLICSGSMPYTTISLCSVSYFNTKYYVLKIDSTSWHMFNCIIKNNTGSLKIIKSSDFVEEKVISKYETSSSGKRPTVPPKYYQFFDKTLNKPIWWNGTAWIDKDGNPADALTEGTTANRPTGVKVGFIYKDTTINKLIVWDGLVWVNINGIEATL